VKEKNVEATVYKAGTRGSNRWASAVPPSARGENETGKVGANGQNTGAEARSCWVVTESVFM
jgi:hypothetical protein